MFLWDAENINHIARHHVTQVEAEQVIRNNPLDAPAYVRNGEQRLNHLGETDSGRVLVVVTTMRHGMTRVVTAHPADRNERKAYAYLKRTRNAKSSEHSRLCE